MNDEAQLLYKGVDGTVDQVVDILNDGQILVLPCDTIYGLSGMYGTTLERLQALKHQGQGHQFILLATMTQAEALCKVPPALKYHWPCALTVILENNDTSGTTAIRVPDDAFIQEILTKLGHPIYSTSVNDSGYTITNITDIIFAFKRKVSAIVVDPTRGRDTPSTMVDCTKQPYELIRCGAYDASDLLA